MIKSPLKKKSASSSVGQNAAFGYGQQKTEKNETVYRIYLDNSNPYLRIKMIAIIIYTAMQWSCVQVTQFRQNNLH